MYISLPSIYHILSTSLQIPYAIYVRYICSGFPFLGVFTYVTAAFLPAQLSSMT